MRRPQTVEEFNRLADVIEANVRGLRHRRHAKYLKLAKERIRALFVSYFQRQAAAVLAAVEPKIKRELVAFPPILKEALEGKLDVRSVANYRALYDSLRNALYPDSPLVEASTRGQQFAAGLIPSSLQPLRFAATPDERAEYNSAIAELVQGAAATLAKQSGRPALADSADDVASRYLRDNSLGKLTIDLGDETEKRLRGALADAWDAGGSYDQMVTAITDTFDGFTQTRVDAIAQTEAVDAYNAARSDIAAEAGFDEKSWETESGNPCATCLANEAEGWIPIDQDHASGDSEPTAHTNCECVENYRSSSGG
jgi:hypothetical protein